MLLRIILFAVVAFFAVVALGFPPFVMGFSARGLDFLIQDKILIPLVLVLLLAGVGDLVRTRRHHGFNPPLVTGAAGAAAVFAGLWLSAALTVVGLLALLMALMWDDSVQRQLAGRPDQG